MCHTTDDKDHFRESPAQKSSDGNGDLAAHAPVPADGTRERSGTFGQSAADSWTYTIYVKREDLERARACLR